MNSNMRAMDSKLERLINEMISIKQENSELKVKVIKQDKKIEPLEREIKRKNIIIKGVVDEESETTKETIVKATRILQKMGIRIDAAMDIDDMRRIGKYREQRNRPILMKLVTGITKMEIIKNARALKWTDIWIEEDYTKAIQARKVLIPKMKEARQNGHKAQIKYNKLIINNKVYDITEIEEISRISQVKYIEEKKKETKRTISERSPGKDSLQQQLWRITKTMKIDDKKNY